MITLPAKIIAGVVFVSAVTVLKAGELIIDGVKFVTLTVVSPAGQVI